MSRNPYHIEGKEPALQPSVLVLMDILGYSELVRRSDRERSGEMELRKLHRSLSSGRRWLQGDDQPRELKTLGEKDFFALKAFTDNIVIGWPVRDDAEVELGDAFFKVVAFQFQLVKEGYFIRGALSVGDAYVDEIAVFGGALIEAYEGESKLARDPRIVLTSSAVTAATRHLSYYGNRRHAPHVRNILKDSDGQWFVNYLECVLWAEDEQGPFYEEFELHKIAIEAKLTEHRSNPPIWSKYAWAAGYHNYFCDLHSRYFSDEHKVNVDLFKQSPELIV